MFGRGIQRYRGPRSHDYMVKRTFVILFIICLMVLIPQTVLAYQSGLLDIEQDVMIKYGESLIFDVRATAASPLTGARLTIRFENRDIYTQSVPVPSQDTTITLRKIIPTNDIQAPPFGELVYYWDFQDNLGVEYRSPEQTLYYEDTSVPWTWAVARQDNILVYTDGTDATVSQAALSIAAAALTDIDRTLGVTTSNDLHLYVYPELTQLANALRLHQLQVQDWVAAFAIPDQHTALIAASPGPELMVTLQRDIPHEITHLVVYEAAGANGDNVPGWFNEGLALTSSPEPDPTLHEVLDDAIQDGVVLSMERLCSRDFSGFSPYDAALAYAQSESMVRYIDDRYGQSQIGAIMDGYADGLSCSGAVERSLGISLDQLEAQWHNDLIRTASRSPQSEMNLIPWIIVWIASLGLALLFLSPQPSQPDTDLAAGPRTQQRLPPVMDESSNQESVK